MVMQKITKPVTSVNAKYKSVSTSAFKKGYGKIDRGIMKDLKVYLRCSRYKNDDDLWEIYDSLAFHSHATWFCIPFTLIEK